MNIYRERGTGLNVLMDKAPKNHRFHFKATYGLYVAIFVCTIVKILAMIEWAPLYRLFLFLPAILLSLATGNDFSEVEGVYTFPGIVLDYSCSGIHFFLMALLLAAMLQRLRTALISAFILSIFANAFRILLSYRLLPVTEKFTFLHESIGTVIFITFLIGYYVFATRFRYVQTRA